MKKLILIFLTINSMVYGNDISRTRKEKLKIIICEAEKKYPNNYLMQAHHIECECEAIIKINEAKKIMEQLND